MFTLYCEFENDCIIVDEAITYDELIQKRDDISKLIQQTTSN